MIELSRAQKDFCLAPLSGVEMIRSSVQFTQINELYEYSDYETIYKKVTEIKERLPFNY